MLSVPRVATIDGTRKIVMTTPLAMPSARPSPIPSAQAAGTGRFWPFSISATTNATRPIVDSTERSMFLVMMTRASPTAAMTMIAVSAVTDIRFVDERKLGASNQTNADSTTTTPASVTSRERASLPIRRPARLGAGTFAGTLRATLVSSAICPVAANMTRSSEASARGISADMRPSWSTMIRSLIARTSGSSLEIRTIPSPEAARSEMMRWTSTFAPMSTPRVGSSRMSTRGSVASHFAMTTFCWFPPDSASISSSTPVERIRNRSV